MSPTRYTPCPSKHSFPIPRYPSSKTSLPPQHSHLSPTPQVHSLEPTSPCQPTSSGPAFPRSSSSFSPLS
ncbi:hypothetical protein BDW62DRAFT_189464, partial [Aspergillus aurantiobrunneus]